MKRAFTLMEVVIAVGVFSLVAGALFLFSSGVADSWRRLTVERNRFQEKIAMDRAIDSLFTGAIPFVWRNTIDEDSSQIPFLIAEPQALRLASLHQLHSPQEGAIRFAEFLLDEGNLIVQTTDRPFNEWSEIPQERIHQTILATEVESIEFRYADWNSDPTKEWDERMFWTDSWENIDSGRTDIPLAILLHVVWQDGREESWLRRTTGNSYRERYGTYNPPSNNADNAL